VADIQRIGGRQQMGGRQTADERQTAGGRQTNSGWGKHRQRRIRDRQTADGRTVGVRQTADSGRHTVKLQ
jgi:hypothetical protein